MRMKHYTTIAQFEIHLYAEAGKTLALGMLP